MHGAERITRRILDEATARARAICEEVQSEAAATVAGAEKIAACTQKQVAERAAREALEQKRRISGMAELEERKELLTVKRDLLESAFRQALEQLGAMDEKAYRILLKRMLLAAVKSGDETVILSPRDLERLDREFWAELNRDLDGAGKKGLLAPATETRNLSGGFILQAGGVECNCSFDSLLKMQREELEPEVAALLFE